MSGALFAALFAAVLVINLAIMLAIVQSDVDLDRVLGSTDTRTASDQRTGFAAVVDTSEHKEETAAGEDQPPSLETAAETVACRACGATNRAGYRYCRWCVQPALHGDGSRSNRDAAATQRPL